MRFTILLAILSMAFSGSAYAAKCAGTNPSAAPDSNVVFTWGKSLPSSSGAAIDFYAVYCNKQEGTDNLQPADRVKTVQAPGLGLSVVALDGTWFCGITGVDTDGNESDFSTEFGYSCNASTPPPPPPPINTKPIAPTNPNAVLHP